jgi:hypothetical protein
MANSIHLDLRFRVVPSDHQIHIVFPGHGYFLYEAFVRSQRIFPELPGLSLVPGIPIDEQPDLEARVAMARRIAAWHASKERIEPPSRRLADYASAKRDRTFNQIKGVLNGFFERGKKGDLVIAPPSDAFSNALIGEIQDDPEALQYIDVPEFWQNDMVPSRRVKWLVVVKRGELSLALQKKFPSPNAFRLLDRENYAEIYDLAYGSYSIEDSYTSRFDVTEATFTTRDDYRLQQLFNVVAALCEQYETKSKRDFTAILKRAPEWDDIIDLIVDESYIPDLSTNINSPGSVILSCPKIVPLVVSGLLALAALEPKITWQAAKADEITVANSQAPPDDPCTVKVAAEVLEQLKLMGFERWQRLCRAAKTLREKTGLKEQSGAREEGKDGKK